MIVEHAAAVLALLNADQGPPPLVVCDGVVPQGVRAPYVLVYFSDNRPELAESHSLVGDSERYVLRAILHCVGGNPTAARMVADRVEICLLDITVAVAGRNCWPIRREEGQGPPPDESTGTTVVDLVTAYRLESIPS